MANLLDRLIIDADLSARRQAAFDEDIFGDIFPDVLPSLDASLPMLPPVPPPTSASGASPKKRAAPAECAVPKVLPPPKLQKQTAVSRMPAVHDAACRQSALQHWAAILAEIADCCSMSLHVGSTPSPDELEPYFAVKRTGTLNLHASA